MSKSTSKKKPANVQGLKKTMHGIMFQVKLLMLFETRGKKECDDFLLYAEYDEKAHLFGDIVFLYKPKSSDSGKCKLQLLQAKHKLKDENKTLKPKDFTENQSSKYLLSDYFISYYKIKKGWPIFEEHELECEEQELEYLIIGTNADLSSEIEFFEEDNDLNSQEKILKYKIKNTSKQSLKDKIKTNLEQNLTSKKSNKKEIFTEILGVGDEKLDQLMSDFLKKYRFFQYPSRDELDDFIKHNLLEEENQEDSGSKAIKTEFKFNSLQAEVLKILEKPEIKGIRCQKNDQGKNCLYLVRQNDQKEEIESSFERFYYDLDKWLCFMICKPGLSKHNAVQLKFDSDTEVKTREKIDSEETQIFHLIIKKEASALGAARVLRALPSGNENYLFMPLRVWFNYRQELAIDKVFSLLKGPLVIVCDEDSEKEEENDYIIVVKQLFEKLSKEVLKENSQKKIILIARKDDKFAEMFHSNELLKVNSLEDETSFKNLGKNSQDDLLKMNVNFQNRNNQEALNKFLDVASAKNFIDNRMLAYLVEELFIKKNKLLIEEGEAFPWGQLRKPDIYINRNFYRQKININKDMIRSKLFFITGANEEDLKDLKDKGMGTTIWKEEEKERGREEEEENKRGREEEEEGEGEGEEKKRGREKEEEGEEIHVGIIIPPPSVNNNDDEKKIFEDIARKVENNIYWLMYHQGELFYIESQRTVASSIPNFIEKVNKTEKKFSSKIDEKVVIVANDAGMGKSMSLYKIAEGMKEHSDIWILRINLNDRVQDLHKIKDKEITDESAIKIVSELAFPKPDNSHHTQRALLQADTKIKIVILFDGFDEICPDYKIKTIELLKALKKSKIAQFWITTRVHQKADLERELESPAYILTDWSKEEQDNFIDKSLKSTSSQKLKDTIQELNRNLIRDTEKQFTSVPLHLKMLVEMINEKIIELEDLNNLKLYDLFDRFIQSKFDILNTEKAKTSQFNQVQKDKDLIYFEIFSKIHCELALKELFEVRYLSDLPHLDQMKKLSDLYKTDGREKQALQRIGLTFQSNDTPRFIHRSYAEYFLNEYLVRNLKNEKVQILLLKEILLKDDYNNSRKFFNSLLDKSFLGKSQKTRSLQEACFKQESFDFEKEKTNVLHIAAQENHFAIIKFLLEKDDSDRTIWLGNEKGENALHLAAEEGYTKFLVDLLSYMEGKPDWSENRIGVKTRLEELLMKGDGYKKTVLHWAAAMGKTDTIVALLNWVKKHFKTILERLVMEGDKNGKTALHWAAAMGKTDTIVALLNWVKKHFKTIHERLVMEGDKNGKTALHWSAKMGRNDTIKDLLDWVNKHLKDVGIYETLVFTDQNHGHTPLHWASYQGHAKTVKVLLGKIQEHLGKDKIIELIKKKNHQFGETALHSAAKNGKKDALKALLEWVEKERPNELIRLLEIQNEGRKTAWDIGGENARKLIEQVRSRVTSQDRSPSRKKIKLSN